MTPDSLSLLAGRDFLPPAAGGSWDEPVDVESPTVATSEMELGEGTHSPREVRPLGGQGIDFRGSMMQLEDSQPEITPSGLPRRPSGAGLFEWRFRTLSEPADRLTDQGLVSKLSEIQ